MIKRFYTGAGASPLRLLCIVSSMDVGGAETFLMKMYRELDTERFQMDFCVSGDGRGYYEDEIEERGGRVFRITRKSASLPKFVRDLYSVVKSNGYDRVLRVGSDPLSALDLWVCRAAGARLLAMRSSNASDGRSGLGVAASRLARGPLMAAVNVKVAPSDLAAEHTFGRRAVERGEVILLRNALDLDGYAFSAESRAAIRGELGIGVDAPVVAHVGRLAPQKNHAFLLRAFAELLRLEPRARLLLVGEGGLEGVVRPRIEELGLGDSVRLLGVRSDVPRILSAADALALPSLYEGMPNVVVEAQAAGLPCVVSSSVTRQADVTGRVAFLPLGDPSVWAHGLLEAASEGRYDSREAMERAGYDAASGSRGFVELFFRPI